MTLAPRLAIVGLVAVAGCTIQHRSDQFACERQADCSTGRTCIDGFCVASRVDAGTRGDGPQAGCPAQCTSCSSDQKTCTIDCGANPNACKLPITCPAGWACEVLCSTADACSKGISCASSKSCTVTCSGKQSCENVICGSGPCIVDCVGAESCIDVRCGAACSCDITCSLDASCSRLVCKGLRCGAFPRGCTSNADGCDTCPAFAPL